MDIAHISALAEVSSCRDGISPAGAITPELLQSFLVLLRTCWHAEGTGSGQGQGAKPVPASTAAANSCM